MSGGQPPPYHLYSSYLGPQQPYPAAQQSYSGPQPPYASTKHPETRPVPAPRSSLPTLPAALRSLRVSSGSSSLPQGAPFQRAMSIQGGGLLEKLPIMIAPKYSSQSRNKWSLPVGFVQARLPDDGQFSYDFALEEKTVAHLQSS